MISNKVKKSISILTLSALLSTGAASSVFAKDNSSANTNPKQNTVTTNSALAPSSPYIVLIGGGPSDSAVWEVRNACYVNLTHDQLDRLNYLYSNIVNSSSYNNQKKAYDVSCLIAGIVMGTVPGAKWGISYGLIAGAGTSAMATFCTNYFSVIQTAANTVNQAYYRGGTQALYVKEYVRPASGETMYAVSWY